MARHTPLGLVILAMFVLAFAFTAQPTVAAMSLFTASLSSAQVVPPNVSPATGMGSVLLDDVASTITVNETFSGLSGPATISHIHGPAAPGVNAPAEFLLSGVPAATSGIVPQQVLSITVAQIADLVAGLFYIDIHTAIFPGGEIRGQLVLATATPTGTPTATPTRTPVPIGGACNTPSQCSSTFCVDGVCCDTPCTGPLTKCNLPGQAGTCASAAAEAPTLTPWGLIVAAILLTGVAAFALRQRVRSR
jgi:CHRD domain-containing protein